jgi:hypothetical protein
MRSTRVLVLAALAAIGLARPAAAQIPEGPYVSPDGRLALAGDLTATVSPSDSDAFFNYTDYEHDALRTTRFRLLGEWRTAAQVSVLGELRVENTDKIDAAALYVRWRPSPHHDFDLQAGRIPPVVGVFARHAYGRDNLVIGTPLAYQYLTSIRPDALPRSADDVLRMRARGWRSSFPIGSEVPHQGIPLITAFRWDTGAEAHWHTGRLDFAGALTRGAPATPAAFGPSRRPTWSGRAAITPAAGLTVGVSAARGQWIEDDVLTHVPESSRQRNVQTLVGADAEFGLGEWLVRGEWLRSAFQIPAVAKPLIASPLVASAGFVEGRYRWHPRWQASLRAEHLAFSRITGTLFEGAASTWDAPVSRIEAVIGYRATRRLELRVGWQEDWRATGRVTKRGYPAAQVLFWF